MKKFLLILPVLLMCLSGVLIPDGSKAQSYCKPSFSGCSTGDSIKNFQFGSFSASPGCLSTGYDTSGVKTSVITVYRGKSYGVLLQSNNAYDQFGIWIDYNKNGSYSDPTELVGMDNNGNGSISQYSGTVTIPFDATPQVTRMRAMVVNGSQTMDYDKTCNSWSVAGEAADYKITIAAYAHDIGLTVLNSPQNLACPSTKVPVQVILRNTGTNTETSIPFQIKLGTTVINSTYNRTLISLASDTFTVGYLNATSSGTYAFKVYSNLSTDGDHTNDTISVSVDLKQPAAPSLSNVNHCGPGSIYLNGASTTFGSTTYWYSSSSSATPIATGDSILVPYLNIGGSATYYAESHFKNTDYITKGQWSTSRSNHGNFFDVFAKRTFTIDSIDVNSSASSTTDSMTIYYRKGSYSGSERNPGDWIRYASVLFNGKGIGNPSRVVLPKPLTLTVGNNYGFYLVPYSYNTYYDTTGTTKVTKANNDMSIKAGSSTSTLFASGGSVSPGRDWNGTIYYHFDVCNSARVSGKLTMLQNAHGANMSKGSPFMGSYATGTVKDPDQICVKDTNTYTLTPPTGMSNSDFGTKWTISKLSFATAKGTLAKDTIVRIPTSTKNGYLKFYPQSNADSVFILRITLTIPSTGCDSVITRYIRVNAKPVSSFKISSGCTGKVMPITNNSTPTGKLTYVWDFGNGDTSHAAVPAYKYFTAGTYTVTLTAYNGPCSAVSTQSVTVYPSPYGANWVKALPFGGSMNTGDIFDPDNVCLGDTNSYQITAPKGMSNSDYGAKWTITNISFGTIYGTKLSDTLLKRPTANKNAVFQFFPSKYGDSIFLIKFTLRSLPGNCDSNFTRYIHARVKPQPGYTFTNACFGSPLTFKDTSKLKISSIVKWLWDFGDGLTSLSQNPTHSYAKAGKYNVTLTVFSDAGCPASVTQTVEQYPRPTPVMYSKLDCNTLPSSFRDTSTIATGAITAWKWSFGDGQTSASKDVLHSYTKSGFYNVKLVTTSSFGCKDSVTQKLRVNARPTAVFTYLNACVGAQIYFANNSVDSAKAATYTWDMGDGKTLNTSAPAYVYTNNGTYQVKLTVKSGYGCTAADSQSITPYVKPVPKMSALPACIGQPAFFADSSNSGAGSTYKWDFGDAGSTLIKATSTTHKYTKAGTYSVLLTITNGGGCIDSQRTSVTIPEFPKAGFTTKDICIGANASFTNTSALAGTGASYVWDFGDGTSYGRTVNVTHKYSKASTYTVKMLVANSLGCPDSVSKSITVNPLPVIDMWTRNQTGYTVTFVPQDTTIGNFKWYFGTNTNDSSSLRKPTFTYPTADARYGVKVVVTSPAGCVSSRIDSVGMGIYGIDKPLEIANGITVYPNPFEGATQITYTLREKSKVSIYILDVQGRQVTQLTDGTYNAGTYTNTFDASKYNTDAGVYFMKIYIGDKYYTTKIVKLH